MRKQDDNAALALFCMFLTLAIMILLILRHGGIPR